MCAIEYNPGHLVGLYLSPDDERDREIELSPNDLKGLKVLGIIATVRDNSSRAITQLAYDPYVLHESRYGVRLRGYQVALLVGMCVVLLGICGLCVYFLRRKSQKLLQRLTHEVKYQEQMDS